MLDLNLDVDSAESTENGGDSGAAELISRGAMLNQMDESVTSNSSLVNADASTCCDGEEDSCSTRAVEFHFGILKGGGGEGGGGGEEEEGKEKEAVTTEDFFRVTGGKGNWKDCQNLGAQSSGSSVDISFQRWKHAVESPGGGSSGGGAARVIQQPPQPAKKSRRGPRSKSSQYRGVTFYRRTGRWESHIWDCGKQVYLGGFDTAHAAARAYDRAAIKFRGFDADINFNIGDYQEDIKQMANLTKEEVVQVLRRQSTSFSRGSPRYRAVRLDQLPGIGPYNKPAIKCNENFETHAYQMVHEANNGAHTQLDLNLGISLPSGGISMPNKRSLWFHPGSNDILCGRNPKMENYMAGTAGDPPFNLLKKGVEHPVPRTVLPSTLFASEERTPEKGIRSGSPQSLSNWTWQAQGRISSIIPTTAPMPLFPIAASSGFSFSATTTPSINTTATAAATTTTLLSSQPFFNPTLHNLRVTNPPCVSPTNSSQHCQRHHPNPPQAPP